MCQLRGCQNILNETTVISLDYIDLGINVAYYKDVQEKSGTEPIQVQWGHLFKVQRFYLMFKHSVMSTSANLCDIIWQQANNKSSVASA